MYKWSLPFCAPYSEVIVHENSTLTLFDLNETKSNWNITHWSELALLRPNSHLKEKKKKKSSICSAIGIHSKI